MFCLPIPSSFGIPWGAVLWGLLGIWAVGMSADTATTSPTPPASTIIPADTAITSPTPPTSTTIPAGKLYGCPPGWLAYQDSCYMSRRVSVTWLDAQVTCHQEGARLASIGSETENQFIFSQLPRVTCKNSHPSDSDCESWAEIGECEKNPAFMMVKCHSSCRCTRTCTDKHTPHKECKYWASVGECDKNPHYMWKYCALSCGCDSSIIDGFWLGLDDRHTQMTFKWSDLSPVTFTNWLNNEPNNYNGTNEDCVKMHTLTGLWSDQQCDQKSTGFVCKKPQQDLDKPTLAPNRLGSSTSSASRDNMWIIGLVIGIIFLIIAIVIIIFLIFRRNQERANIADKKNKDAELDVGKELMDKSFDAFSRSTYENDDSDKKLREDLKQENIPLEEDYDNIEEREDEEDNQHYESYHLV